MDKPRINPETGDILEDENEKQEPEVITTRYIKGKVYQICSDGKIYQVEEDGKREIEVNDKNRKLVDEIISLYSNVTTDNLRNDSNKGEIER